MYFLTEYMEQFEKLLAMLTRHGSICGEHMLVAISDSITISTRSTINDSQ